MKELSKSITRRLAHSNFVRKYFVGLGIDIGGKPDPLALYQELFPLIQNVRTWDLEDGDAQQLASVPDETYDFVHSSHCLEHLYDPKEGLDNWLRVLKPGGHMILTVPDEDLYEQGEFPSTKNKDHKWTFTIYKQNSWSQKSINLLELLMAAKAPVRIEKIELLNTTFRYNLPSYDQTKTPIGECAIECVLQKMTEKEVARGGLHASGTQPPEDQRIHYNQYKDDYKQLISGNSVQPPFKNSSKL